MSFTCVSVDMPIGSRPGVVRSLNVLYNDIPGPAEYILSWHLPISGGLSRIYVRETDEAILDSVLDILDANSAPTPRVGPAVARFC